jgi:hypothetical protein
MPNRHAYGNMKKHIVILLFSLSVVSVFYTVQSGYAFDKGGCLTCHKYPGLVKYEKPDKVTVLHIDEGKHLTSPHGRTDCKACHPNTAQVPHTGVKKVDCTSKCHFEDRDKIDNIIPSDLQKYHKEEKFAITKLDDKTACRVCHPLYPHSANNKVRALLNMHIGFMLCEVCHLKKEGADRLAYEWKEPEEFEFTGEPYGTHSKQEAKEPHKSDSIISKMLRIMDRESDGEEKAGEIHLISRIAVFKTEKGKKTLFVNTHDNKKAEEYLKKEKNMSGSDKEKELEFFHLDIAKKEISVACDECHSTKGILDFRNLGFSKNKARDLQYLNIKGLVTKYDTFYFPNLFGPGE